MNEYHKKIKNLNLEEQQMYVDLIMSAYDCFLIEEETKNILLEKIDKSFDLFF